MGRVGTAHDCRRRVKTVQARIHGFAGNHLFEVPELAHQFPDPLPLSEDLVLGENQLFLGVERPFPPRCLDALVLVLGDSVVAALVVGHGGLDEAAGVGVLVEERGGDACALGDRADGESAALAAELTDGLLDADEFVLGLASAGDTGDASAPATPPATSLATSPAELSRRLFTARLIGGATTVVTVGYGTYGVLRIKRGTVPLARLPRSRTASGSRWSATST